MGTSLGALNYDTNFWKLVKSDRVEVQIADIECLSSKTIHLSTGETFETDALVCCTGWRGKPPFQVLPDGADVDLGLPPQTTRYDELARQADAEIVRRFPMLADRPTGSLEQISRSEGSVGPFRLWRFIAPPAERFDRSIVFLGMLYNPPFCVNAELQSLWSVAYLTGKMVLDKRTSEERAQLGVSSEQERLWETVLTTQFGMWRSPAGNGFKFPDWVFDGMPYHDMLLRDLGLKFRRKSNFLKEWFTPYVASDYGGLIQEWLEMAGNADGLR